MKQEKINKVIQFVKDDSEEKKKKNSIPDTNNPITRLFIMVWKLWECILRREIHNKTFLQLYMHFSRENKITS